MRFLQLVAITLACLLSPGCPLDVFGMPDWSSLSRCSLFGKSHIRTFDGTFYDFVGDCSYVVAGDCQKHTFSLVVDYKDHEKKSISMYLGEYYDVHMFFDGTATEGEKSISLPYASNGIYLENEAGYYKLSSREHGILVKIDNSGNVQIVFSSEHFNRTCGLCGNFNQFAEDDYMTQEGILADKSHDFANSWALHGGEKRCKRIYPPSNTCNISSDAAEKDLLHRCQLLKSSTAFATCHTAVDPEPFVALCEKDMCTCAEDVHCPCQTFLEYARTCAQHGVIVRGWPKEAACNPRCPHGMQYSECVSPCLKTCQSLNINEVCQENCIDGCRCPAGKILDGNRCIDDSECSCMHAGKQYPTGATVTQDCNTCICSGGLWECSNEDCPGECVISGQSHYKSFDNKHFTFSGVCHYLLAKDNIDNTFSVGIETVQCADDQDAVCIQSASVRLLDLQNITIKLKHGGGVSVDGQDIALPLLHGALRIQTTALTSVRLLYREDLQIDWDGRGKLLLKLSPTYADSTSGLCGNYNGNQRDDFLSLSGLVEASVEDFANSWKVDGDCEDLLKQDTDPCILNPKRARFAEDVCSALMEDPFEPCHHKVSPLPYLKNCRYDVCSCSNGKECLCSAIASYASACSRKGVLIEWRTPEFCPMICSEGKVYRECGYPCNHTCRSLSHPDANCKGSCMEGCYCPPGFYTNEFNECVPKSECPCYYDGEVFQRDDVFSNHHSMCYCEEGMMHCISNDHPGSYYPDVYFSQSARVKRSLICRPPLRKAVCSPDNPTIRGTECAKTCQNYEFECPKISCISGCLCPENMVRHGDRCIKPSACPCFHAGKDYDPGESVEIDCNTCVCKDRKWQCTENLCDGTCSAIGVSHYLTFDGMTYNFPGNCQYVMAQDYCNGEPGSFRILIGNVGCGFTGEKCTKKITIYFRGGEIELANEQVNIRKPLNDDTGVQKLQSGNFYILILGSDMSVTWDRGLRVYLTLKENLRGKVCGLCGNFDDVENNDLNSSTNQLEVNPSDFGDSWKVSPQCANAAPFSSATSMPLCQGNVQKQAAVEHACAILRGDTFKACEKLVNPIPYYEICLYDTCTCESIGDCACFCDSIAAYAHVCAQKGVVVQWRSSQRCPQSCEERNQMDLEYVCEWRYNSCAPACPATCQHPEHTDCPLRCVEGCQAHCPPGKILDEDTESCIDLKDCHVCVVDGRHIPHGAMIFRNQDDPGSCQQCHCEERDLHCSPCDIEHSTPAVPTTTLEPEEDEDNDTGPTVVPYTCQKAMDLVFLVDSSSTLSQSGFEIVKDFIASILEKIRISQKRIRVSVVQYHSTTTKLFLLKEKDRIKLNDMITRVRNMKYTAEPTASLSEAFKYAIHYVFKVAPRENAPKMIVLLTTSENKSPINRRTWTLMEKFKITVIPIAIGPHVSMKDIRLIHSKSSDNKPFMVANVEDLPSYEDEIIDYLCGLVPGPTKAPTTTATVPTTTVKPSTNPPPSRVVTILVEDSDKVGKDNFTETKKFLEKVVEEIISSEEIIYVTIIMYSYTITTEYTFTGRESKQDIIHRIRELRYTGGNATNTGKALWYVNQKITTERSQVPHPVYMIQSNPPTDVITTTNLDQSIDVTPIIVGVRPRDPPIRELEIFKEKPIRVPTYTDLITITPKLLEDCCSVPEVVPPTLIIPPHRTEPPCLKLMDVIFLVDGSVNIKPSEFELMKTFVKNFINKAHIGPEGTQVAVIQYSSFPQLEIVWTDPQDKISLLKQVDAMQKMDEGHSKIGGALNYATQSAMSEVHGARPTSSKIAVIIVADKSVDHVDDAARYAADSRISVYPIGIGSRYDEEELSLLAGADANYKITKVQLFEDLPTMVLLGGDFINKLCTDIVKVCYDEDGLQRNAGERWTMKDPCNIATCLTDGTITMESHKVNCMKMPKPVCDSSQPPFRVDETCGCRWVCPCVCRGSSNRYIVTFDGLNFMLLGKCPYVLFEDKANNVEVVLQNGECSSVGGQTCMESVQIKHNQDTVTLSHDMQVSVNGRLVTAPYHDSAFAIEEFGQDMHEVKIEKLGFQFTFTPSSNEFMLQLNPHMFNARTAGLCGSCDQNSMNDFMLKNGSVSDRDQFIRQWTLADRMGRTCAGGIDRECTKDPSPHCNILLQDTFQACHAKIPPSTYYELCQDNSCRGQDFCETIAGYSHECQRHGICIDWRTAEFCPMTCPSTTVYDHCRSGCTKDCGGTHNATVCSDHPIEGCFCPVGDVTVNGKCVPESTCTQCVDNHGVGHRHLETWIPDHDPCSICICLDDRVINCSSKPCPTVKPITCGPCEIPQLKTTSDHCCPEYECVCDKYNCHSPPIPQCDRGLDPELTNPGDCQPHYACVCKRETCSALRPPSCPPYKTLTRKSTECCDEYECLCSCSNSTDTCPPGYISTVFTNECGCTTVSCSADQVCVHKNNVFRLGSKWEDACQICSCTDLEDAITGLRKVRCVQKPCDVKCEPGFKYVALEHECCGTCKRAVCEQRVSSTQQRRGDSDASEGKVLWYSIGAQWASPNNPCIINECVSVNGEVFTLEKNVSCSDIETRSCPAGLELKCSHGTECCPVCQCVPIPGCLHNGTIIGPGKKLWIDECSFCECSLYNKLTCRHTRCEPCPPNSVLEKVEGNCCGKCLPTVCTAMKDGNLIHVDVGKTVREGCSVYTCKSNELGELTLETMTTSCPPFDHQQCLADGGKIVQHGDTCCETCEEPECKQISGVLKYVRVDDCETDRPLAIRYCEGKCTSKSVYAIETHRMEDQCICCSATQTEPMKVPLRCANGTMVEHEVLQATNCECQSSHCTK